MAKAVCSVAGTSKDAVNVRELIWNCAEEAAHKLYKDNVFEFTNGRFPRSFSRADIAVVDRTPKAVPSGNLYKPGFEFLKKAVDMDTDGMGDCGLKEAYKRLEAFVRNRDLHLKCLEKVFNRKNVSKTAITTVMAVHLFGQLVAKDAVIVDKRMKKGIHNECPCGCGAGFHVGNTGIDRDLHLKCLEKVFNRKNVSKTAITTVMAVHLFGQLVAKDAVIVDKRMKKGIHNECPCGCGAGFHVGNTGIGVPRAWHGFADMLVHDVPVVSAKASDDGDKEEESGEESEEPPKKKCRVIESNLQQGDDTGSQLDQPSEMYAGTAVEVKREHIKSEVVISQMVATTITNSFAQGAEKPELELEKKFLPSICCSKQGAIICMYNVDHDLFLNKHVDDFFIFVEERQENEFNLVLIIQIWLALNICWTGCDASKVKSFFKLVKSGFQNRNERIIYKNAKLKISHFEDYGEKMVEVFFRFDSLSNTREVIEGT